MSAFNRQNSLRNLNAKAINNGNVSVAHFPWIVPTVNIPGPNDTIELGRLPAGAIIIDGYYHWKAVGTGTITYSTTLVSETDAVENVPPDFLTGSASIASGGRRRFRTTSSAISLYLPYRINNNCRVITTLGGTDAPTIVGARTDLFIFYVFNVSDFACADKVYVP